MIDLTANDYWMFAVIPSRALSDWTARTDIRFAYGLNDPFVVFIIVGARRWVCDVEVFLAGAVQPAGTGQVQFRPDGTGDVHLDLHPRPEFHDGIRPLPDGLRDILVLPGQDLQEVAAAVEKLKSSYDLCKLEVELDTELSTILRQAD